MAQALPQRLATEFRQKIRQGSWCVGTRLPTNRELAVTYGVSVNTIQHAFRQLEQEDLVERRPRVGGFVKNRPLHLEVHQTGTTIGVVGPYTDAGYASDAVNSWGHRIISGCDAELLSQGFHTSMFSYVFGDPEALKKVIEKIDEVGSSLAGVLCFSGPIRSKLLAELDRRNIPWVTANRPERDSVHNFVAPQAFQAARLIGRCFARMGFAKAAVLGTPFGIGASSDDKLFGFLEGWLESGMPLHNAEYLMCDSHKEETGYSAFGDYVKREGPPRGVLASGDLLALGVCRACRELGLVVPDDVAVVGTTGLPLSAYSHPSLTVLDNRMEQMGQYAARMLLEMAREGVRHMIGRYAEFDLIVRESCPIPSELVATELAAMRQS